MQTSEKICDQSSGWPVLIALFVALGVGLSTFVATHAYASPALLVFSILCAVAWVFTCCGFFTLQPNESAVLVLFGDYRGTVKASGFKWANPLLSKFKVSLRARNWNGDTIKVNDSRGNPIEIATVVVWQVENTARAVFDVDDFAHFVRVQSESALRHLAMAYPYDNFDDDQMSLQGSTDEVSDRLQREIQERVEKAGVRIIEARLSHLAYAQEIAGAMLQRQQAEAIVAARARIVDGATGMVKMALEHLEHVDGLELDPERRAHMVSNLLVVLCGHHDVTPVINTGSMY